MRIYSREDFAEGRIPRPEDFPEALKEFEEYVVMPYLGQQVLGSFAYGSVRRNDFNVASDIDYMIVIEDPTHMQRIREGTRLALANHNVNIQTRMFLRRHAEAGFNRIDAGFRQHLDMNVRRYGCHGRNPLEIIANGGASFEEALRESAASYVKKLTNGYCNYHRSENEYLDFLKTLLEKPWHAMRIAVQWEYGTTLDEDPEFTDTKAALLARYKAIQGTEESLTLVEPLETTSRGYIELLELRQDEPKCPPSLVYLYKRALQRIEDCHTPALRFVESVAERLR